MSHLIVLHASGSSDPLMLTMTPSKISFHPYYTAKDSFIFLVVFASFVHLVCFSPNYLGHSDNFLPADPLVTPAHIVPEWYFTPFYAILRACPNKIGGAVAMIGAIVIHFALPLLPQIMSFSERVIACVYSGWYKVATCALFGIFFILMFLGMSAAEAPFVVSSKVFTVAYFLYFILVLPALG
jgi:quinol-cytochrome oxidoreductase complex cytochrome b subunit